MASSEHDPLWYKDAVFYELHVKAFQDSNGDGVGDFRGLVERLDYVRELGVDAIWLLPCYPSPLRDDGYDIADYLGVHPNYGTLGDFQDFLDAAHQRGLRVIADLVLNHTSDQHPWFQRARKAPPGSPERDFYVWSDTDEPYRDARVIFIDSEPSNWTWDAEAGQYYWHRFFHHQPDLNWDNPAVKEAIFGAMEFWLERGLDGFRADAVPYLIEREGTNCENLPETHAVLKELRARVDAKYPGRVLLAEANQWPDDVRPYFGDGDEFQLAFHFPLMPRIFMAIRQGIRKPVVEIIERTPEIPPECQWCMFLRNHDELTLEMVTDEERDYMYNEYAADPRMRLNLGIRRRLAPLMENDRRKVELLNSLLFTLPGSPVLYYGDELGMGDNIWLGDRDGVRTPMQWSPDRNAGFSHAEAARLYLPVIVDSVYGYQAINVEAQERSPFSLLNWTKRLIQVRKRHPALGRGSIEFPRPENPHVLAHLREHDGNTILVVHNLSASAQPVQLDLARFAGVKPVELLGDTEFPPVGESPYTLTLGPYGFFWFGLPVPEPARTEVAARPGEPGDGEMERLAALVGEVSSEWLREQRWFRGKGKSSVRLRLADALRLPGEGGEGSVYLVLADAEHREGEPERYLLVAAVSAGPETEPSVSSVLLGESELHLWEVAEESDPAAAILTLLRSGSELAGREGRFTFALPSPAAVPAPAAEVRPLGREQSNTSLFVGPDRVLKLYRHIEPGVNPDLELARYLSVDADFPNVPALFGWVEYEDAGGERWSLAALSEFVPNQGDGWTLALERLRGTLTEPAGESGFGEDLIRLGEVTGRLHLALAGLGSAGVTEEDVREWAGVMIREQEWVLDELAVRLKSMPGAFSPELQAGIATLLRGRGELHAVTNGLARLATVSQKIRGHGDYHLGQVLRTAPEPEVPGGWMVLDFEGEVARPLAERREPHSPLRDVAGMLRSLDYAVRTVARERVDTPSWDPAAAAAWLRQAREEFLDGYFGTVKGSGLVPDPPEAWRPALVALELEKAVYEMRYEMDNRPEWLGIPVAGVVGLIGSEA